MMDRTMLLEGTMLLEDNSDEVAMLTEGLVGRNVNWKVRWIQTLLLEGTLDPDVVAGRGLEAASIGRGSKGLDPDVVAGRIGSGRCCWKGRWI